MVHHIRFSRFDKKQKSHFNKKDKCLQYAVTFALSHEEIKKDPQIITKIKAFKNKYN